MEVQEQKSWFARNWGWVVPVGGCGCGCLGLVLFAFLGIGATIFSVFDTITNATPVTYAVEQASINKKVINLLGEPIEEVGIPSGNISLENENGEVDFSIAIKGSKEAGTLVVRGMRFNGEWIYEDLYVRVQNTNQIINLLPEQTIQEDTIDKKSQNNPKEKVEENSKENNKKNNNQKVLEDI
ncbi:cytochrome c oxidase assembly factor Coa1 family protein [Tenacibaculum piscium]|uniref:cytochrome c oxidase assembly factor Coa1 family protein n=1 Tax=Tenacibaculum piscium TaxID=1458515 RepID=UPI001F176CAA|nr:cytochrome c oxidase assembly factor Coa1 family protein [Tenacibaculum piscium]